MSEQADSGSTESTDELATVQTAATPHTSPWLPDAEMNGLAPCTHGLPPRCSFNCEWN